MIYYILENENSRVVTLSRRNNYIETKKIFNHNIFKINKNRLLLKNKHKLGIIVYIMRNNQKEFLIKKKNSTYLKNKSIKLLNSIITDC